MPLQQSKSKVSSQEGLVTNILFRYLPYWPLFIIVIGLFIGGAYFYLLRTTPTYKAVASLVIKDQNKGNTDPKTMEALDVLTTKKIVENEVEVLHSWALMSNVAKTLHLYAPIYREARFRSTSAYLTSPVRVEVKDPENLKSSEKIGFEVVLNNSAVRLSTGQLCPMNKWVQTPYGALRFIPNKRYKKPLEETPLYFKLASVKSLSSLLLGKLDVAPTSKLSAVIQIGYKDEVPEKAEDVLNELMKAYGDAIINDKKRLTSNTIAFVDERMDAVAKELDSIEKNIQQYRASTGAIDITTQGELVLQNVSENDRKLSEINTRLNVLDRVESLVSSRDEGGTIAPATLGVDDPSLSHLLTKLYEAQLDYEQLKGTVAENHPMVMSIKDQINRIKPSILNNIQSQRNNLLASRSNIYSTNNVYNSMLQSMPQKERNLQEIGRDRAIKSSIYSFLLQKREESAISSAATVSDMKIVDMAQASSSPISPKKSIVYGISIVLGILTVIGLIGTKELFARKLLYRQEIESYTSIPIIGEITYKKQPQLIVVEEGKKSLKAEEFRKIRITLPYLGIGPNSKKILVTSSIAGEGKSFVAVNLAQTLALTGKKVALVDMDLHNPSLEKIMAEQVQSGVSEYLAGTAEFGQIINQTAINNKLFFIPAGSIHSNPSELLCSDKLKELISNLENQFDYVIIDTAPVVPVSDAYELSAYCNATLFVVRHKYTPKMFIQRLDESMKINPLKNPAIIFNGVSHRGFMKNSYGYGYGYGNTYILEDKKSKPKLLA